MNLKKGFTLIELIVAIALVSIIIAGASNMIIFAMRAHELSVDEFDVQANLRLLSHKINDISRDSAGAFILYREDATNMTPGWNYIMLNADKTKMLEYTWNEATSKHDIKELYAGAPGVTLGLTFEKSNAPDEDKLVIFNLNMTVNGQTRAIDSEVESINALQVVDRAYGKVANTISYRNDKRVTEISNAQAAVAMVLDTSGSMDNKLDGTETNKSADKRLTKMKVEALRLIDELAKNPSVYISLNPFSTTANDSKEMLKAQANNGTNSAITGYFSSDDFEADGGTNTGDGIRRAYHRIKDFNEKTENLNKVNKNFMIILVDGATTFASVDEVYWNLYRATSDKGSTFTDDGIVYTKYRTSGSYRYYSGFDPSRTVFRTGNANTSDDSADEEDHESYSGGAIVGNGAYIDPIGTAYVNEIGELVRTYKEDTAEAIKVYVIGFSSVAKDMASLEDIAVATTGSTQYYTAGSSEALQAIFSAIQKDISDALWHIGGPN